MNSEYQVCDNTSHKRYAFHTLFEEQGKKFWAGQSRWINVPLMGDRQGRRACRSTIIYRAAAFQAGAKGFCFFIIELQRLKRRVKNDWTRDS